MTRYFYTGIALLAATSARAANAAASLPTALENYRDPPDAGLWDVLAYRASADPFNVYALAIFVCAIIHTFVAARIRHWAHVVEQRHAAAKTDRMNKPDSDSDGVPDEVSFAGQMLHFLGEVEAVFGIWAVILAGAITWVQGWPEVVG